MLGKLEFLTKVSHQFVDERFAIIGDNISRYAILINDVRPNEVDDILFFNFL